MHHLRQRETFGAIRYFLLSAITALFLTGCPTLQLPEKRPDSPTRTRVSINYTGQMAEGDILGLEPVIRDLLTLASATPVAAGSEDYDTEIYVEIELGAIPARYTVELETAIQRQYSGARAEGSIIYVTEDGESLYYGFAGVVQPPSKTMMTYADKKSAPFSKALVGSDFFPGLIAAIIQQQGDGALAKLGTYEGAFQEPVLDAIEGQLARQMLTQ